MNENLHWGKGGLVQSTSNCLEEIWYWGPSGKQVSTKPFGCLKILECLQVLECCRADKSPGPENSRDTDELVLLHHSIYYRVE